MIMNIPNPIQYGVWIELNLCDLRKDARFHPEGEIDGLAQSLQIKQLQPILVCRNGGRYEVLAGVGRFLAAGKLGWEKIRADVYEGLDDVQKLDMIFTENEDRANASPLYQANLLNGMMKAGNLTQEQLGDRIGKDQTTVSLYLRLEGLSPRIWENTNAFVKFGMRHFIQLLRIENKDDQWKLAEMARAKDLSSSELAALIDKHLGVKAGAKKTGRPKGDKKVGADGFAFVQKGSNLRIKAIYDMSGDLPDRQAGLDAFLTQLKAAILTWRTSHPLKAAKKSPQSVA